MTTTRRTAQLTRRSILGGALAAAATGCDALSGQALPENPVWIHRPGGVLGIAYRRLVTDQNKIEDLPYERGRPAIDERHLRVFVGSQDGGLYAIDARSGDTIWRFSTLGPVQSEPLYDPEEDVVYFGSTDGAIYKVRAQNGDLVYRFFTNAEVARRPVIDGDAVFLTNANDTLISLDRKTGKMRWYQHRTPAFGIEIGGYAGVAVARGKAFTAFSDGVVMAYATSDGAEQWPTVDLAVEAQTPDGRAPQYLDADATPIVGKAGEQDAVFVAHYEGGAYALEPDTGRTIWRNDGVAGITNMLLWEQPAHAGRKRADGSTGPDAPARRVLVASSGRTGLWGLDPDDRGKVLWRKKLPEGGISAPVAISGAILVTTTRYGIFLFEPTQGLMIDGIEPGNEIAMTPAAHGQHAFVMTNGGYFLSIVVARPPGAEKKKRG
jgi:outer membrane protein assembly factor BamB